MRSFLLFMPLLALSLVAISPAAAQEVESVFDSANQDFADGNYEQAALKYESLVEKGLLSPDLFYNLGTTYFRLEEPGKSMLALRRAQILDPMLPEARQNIEVLRNQLGFLEFSDSTLDRFLRLLPRNIGGTLGAALVWGALIAITAGFVLPRAVPYRSGLITLAIVLFLCFVVVWRADAYKRSSLAPESFSIVVADNVKALTSPTPGARSVIDLPAGSEVRLVQISGPWRYIDIPGALRGWVRAEQVEPVWPVPDTR
ncbi:MAG: tetratricopeptide repeat protein [Verrucomicrobiales bacterium]|nr:tetratricopeptide repeat protein [Verrucomicrobiales bacterium]